MTREQHLEEVRLMVVQLIDSSAKSQLANLEKLLQEQPALLDDMRNQPGCGDPWTLPKVLAAALHIREAWTWGPPGARIQMSLSHSAGRGSKLAKKAIETLRRLL